MKTHTLRILDRARRAWGEMDHAQRRSFELRTGIPGTAGHADSARTEIEMLNALFAARSHH